MPTRKTVVSIEGDRFLINGRPTYEGRTAPDSAGAKPASAPAQAGSAGAKPGRKVEGLLLNARLVQGIFDDLNPETRGLWNYPDGPWDAERNTREFVAAMPAWRKAGLLSFTINLQGGSPRGYSKDQPWHNSAFREDGSLRPEYLARLERILDRADDLGMAPLLGYFYFGQDHRLKDEGAVLAAADAATDWLLEKRYANVLVEIGNEVDLKRYVHEVIRAPRCHEPVRRVQERSAGRVGSPARRLLASASFAGGRLPAENVVAAADFVLLHGNGVQCPDGIREMVRKTRALAAYRGQPVLFNEDDHFDFGAPDNNFLAAVGEYAGWGLFDYRMKGEGYAEGFQSVPVNWGMSSERKRGFFRLLADLAGSPRP